MSATEIPLAPSVCVCVPVRMCVFYVGIHPKKKFYVRVVGIRSCPGATSYDVDAFQGNTLFGDATREFGCSMHEVRAQQTECFYHARLYTSKTSP